MLYHVENHKVLITPNYNSLFNLIYFTEQNSSSIKKYAFLLFHLYRIILPIENYSSPLLYSKNSHPLKPWIRVWNHSNNLNVTWNWQRFRRHLLVVKTLNWRIRKPKTEIKQCKQWLCVERGSFVYSVWKRKLLAMRYWVWIDSYIAKNDLLGCQSLSPGWDRNCPHEIVISDVSVLHWYTGIAYEVIYFLWVTLHIEIRYCVLFSSFDMT